jgi:hypothetical protein
MDVGLLMDPSKKNAASKTTIETAHPHQGIDLPVKRRIMFLTGAANISTTPNNTIARSQFPVRNIESVARPKITAKNQLKVRVTYFIVSSSP